MFPISSTLKLLQVAAPPDALDSLLRWVQSLRGGKGRRVKNIQLVAHDDRWTEVLAQPDPEVWGSRRKTQLPVDIQARNSVE